MNLMESHTPATTVQAKPTTGVIGLEPENVKLHLPVKKKGDQVRKRNLQESEPIPFSGVGHKLTDKGSPPKYGRASPSSSVKEESERKVDFCEKDAEISELVYETLDAYNNGECKQRFKVYSRAEVMKFLDEYEEGKEDAEEEGQPKEEEKHTERNWTEGATASAETSELPRTIYGWREDIIKTVDGKRQDIDRIDELKKAVQKMKGSKPLSLESLQHMKEVLTDREDLLQEIEKEVSACAHEEKVEEFGEMYAKSKALKTVIGKMKKMIEEMGVYKGEKEKVDGGKAGPVKDEFDDIKQEEKKEELKVGNE